MLEEGAIADLTVFDPATIRGNATVENPNQFSSGIDLVIVSGKIAFRDGKLGGKNGVSDHNLRDLCIQSNFPNAYGSIFRHHGQSWSTSCPQRSNVCGIPFAFRMSDNARLLSGAS